jgi:hypothetical protein
VRDGRATNWCGSNLPEPGCDLIKFCPYLVRAPLYDAPHRNFSDASENLLIYSNWPDVVKCR